MFSDNIICEQWSEIGLVKKDTPFRIIKIPKKYNLTDYELSDSL